MSTYPVLNKLPSKSVIMFPCCLGILISNHTSPIFASAYIISPNTDYPGSGGGSTSFHGTSSKFCAYCLFNPLKNSGAPTRHAATNKLKKFTNGKLGNTSTPSTRLCNGTFSPANNNCTKVCSAAVASRKFCRQR